ncbi:Ubiquitin-conjugating enzyme E2 R1 [Manis javanica]|nr:Ubiquitin-conjugating enzyme E2 R1 [Manis javanica]
MLPPPPLPERLSEGTAAPAQGAVREASLQFPVTLVDEDDLYNWEVSILGSLNTYYEGGYFTALQVRHGLPLLPAGLHQDVADNPDAGTTLTEEIVSGAVNKELQGFVFSVHEKS